MMNYTLYSTCASNRRFQFSGFLPLCRDLGSRKGGGRSLTGDTIAAARHCPCQWKVWLLELYDEAGQYHMSDFGSWQH